VLGNSSGQVGRNVFHFQTTVAGFVPRARQRSRAVSNGISDFRSVVPAADVRSISNGSSKNVYMGGICDGSAGGMPITTDGSVWRFSSVAWVVSAHVRGSRSRTRCATRLSGSTFLLDMVAEDAPQLSNQVDLDPTVRDIFDVPVPRITSKSSVRTECAPVLRPVMKQIVANAGATAVFIAPCDAKVAGPPPSAQTDLRMGDDPATSRPTPKAALHVDNPRD
jgi:hypothetical protein